MAKDWAARKDAKYEIAAVQNGEELLKETSIMEDDSNVIHHDFTSLKMKYEVIIVITSSYGEGDPPENFAPFFLELLHAAEMGSLHGMQHAVFGQGSTVYQETFQNIPRLTDKLLGEAGSRRFVMRHETDAAHYIEGDHQKRDKERFREACFDALQRLPPACEPPVCGWGEASVLHEHTTDKIRPKTLEDLKEFRASGAVTGVNNQVAVGLLCWAAFLGFIVARVSWYSSGGDASFSQGWPAYTPLRS